MANDLVISNVNLTGVNTDNDYVLVEFDITWENSWRTTSGPANWDAAWVFVKYKESGGDWQHAWLNNDGHFIPSGTAVDIGLQDADGVFNSTTNPGIGAFIFRTTIGTGTFLSEKVKLRWNYGANGVPDNFSGDIRVFAVEMVQITQGSYFLGSGGTESGSFTDGSWTTGNSVPYEVTSEGSITIDQSGGALWGTSSSGTNTIGPAGTLAGAFPKGYDRFYCMKYEITQQQYVDFLNMLTQTQADVRKYTGSSDRYAITGSAVGSYATTNPYVACNFLNWEDVAAILDWMGLRPMTELEFEKAARGGGQTPVPGEFVWGAASKAGNAYTLANAGANNEVISVNYSLTNGNVADNVTTGAIGPFRVGIFATGTSDRVLSGAGFYGTMELSGNLWERVISIGNTSGRDFAGDHGNGSLTVAGEADVINWPTNGGYRGGHRTSTDGLETSARNNIEDTYDTRDGNLGGRGVRSWDGTCYSGLAGTYSYESSDLFSGSPSMDIVTGTVEIISLGDNRFEFSDCTFGVFNYYFGLTVQAIEFTDDCGVVEFTDLSFPYGTYTVISTISGEEWTLQWENATNNTSATSVITFPGGVPFVNSN